MTTWDILLLLPAVVGAALYRSPCDLLPFVREGGRVVVLPKAMRAARKAKGVDMGRLRDALGFLRDSYVPHRRGEISLAAYEAAKAAARVDEQPSMSEPGCLATYGYTAVWEGRTVLLDRHVKWGCRAPSLVRLYFHWCPSRQIAVIGWMPTHLQTKSTN